jgi:hypothetical protein
MADPTDRPARGKVTGIIDSMVVFNPVNTTYRMHLLVDGGYSGELNKPIQAIVRVTARKVYTVPSGGNFVVPIFGPPRILQGRVLSVQDKVMMIHAGLPVMVDLPAAETAIDLDNGYIAVGAMVNVTVLPGARFKLLTPAPAAAAAKS